MSNPILFIPGTGGTTLLKNGQTLGHPVVINLRLWLLKTIGQDIDQTVQDMSMEHRTGQVSPVRTTLAPGAEVKPGRALTAAYNQILPRSQEVFPYDWRGCIEHSATQLLDFLEASPPANGWRLVTHSQGGLVAIAASKLYAERYPGRDFSKLVSHIAFVAVPVYGTLNAAHALAVGNDLGEAANDEFKKIAGTWPALYQMLPAWYALRTPSGDYSRYSFFHVATWEKYPWVQPDLVARGWNVRKRLLGNPVSNLQRVRYTFILTRNQRTWNRATRRDDGTLEFGERDVEGDSLVPFNVTYNMMSDVEQQRCHVVGPNENTPEHSMMLTGDWITSRVLEDLDA